MTTPEVSAPATTVRMFGRCSAKGCRTRVVVDVEAAFDNRAGSVQPTIAGQHAMLDVAAQRAQETCCASVPFGRLVPVVIDGCHYSHGSFLWSGVKGRLVPSIECNSRCADSRSPECKCSCGGARHGEAAS